MRSNRSWSMVSNLHVAGIQVSVSIWIPCVGKLLGTEAETSHSVTRPWFLFGHLEFDTLVADWISCWPVGGNSASCPRYVPPCLEREADSPSLEILWHISGAPACLQPICVYMQYNCAFRASVLTLIYRPTGLPLLVDVRLISSRLEL